MVAFADLVLPDTTYLERHDCISLLDRPDLRGGCRSRTAIRWPVVEPDRDVRGIPERCWCELGVPMLGLAGLRQRRWRLSQVRRTTPTISSEPRAPSRRRAPGRVARRWTRRAAGAVRRTRSSSRRYIENGGFWIRHTCRTRREFFKPWNMAYQDWAVKTRYL